MPHKPQNIPWATAGDAATGTPEPGHRPRPWLWLRLCRPGPRLDGSRWDR